MKQERPREIAAALLAFGLVAFKAAPIATSLETLIALVSGLILPAQLWAARGLVDVLARGGSLHDASPVWRWTAMLVALAAADNLTRVGHGWLSGFSRPRASLAMERSLLRIATELPLATVERSETQDVMARAREALGYRVTNLATFLTGIAHSVASGVGYLLVLYMTAPVAAVVVLVPAIPSALLKLRASAARYMHDYDGTPSRRKMGYFRDLTTDPTSAQEARLFGLSHHLLGQWKQAHRHWRQQAVSQATVELLSDLGANAGHIASYIVVVLLIAMAIEGGKPLGDFVALTGATLALQGQVEAVFSQLNYILQDLPYVSELVTLGILEDGSQSAATPVTDGVRGQGLALRGVSFRYPGQSDDALRDVSLDLRSGEVVALVGPNGAGKTTLVKVALGLYKACSGTVELNGVSIHGMSADVRARSCAAVFQDFAHFRRPLREELWPGDGTPEDRLLWGALASVGLEEKCRALPNGLDTFTDPSLGDADEGIELSGGEWRRVALARALARDAHLLVLDEPTASLDPQAEVDLYKSFVALAKGRMTLLVTHRIGAARLADRIVVLSGGAVVEEGTHEQLVGLGGLYAQMFEAQAKWYNAS